MPTEGTAKSDRRAEAQRLTANFFSPRHGRPADAVQRKMRLEDGVTLITAMLLHRTSPHSRVLPRTDAAVSVRWFPLVRTHEPTRVLSPAVRPHRTQPSAGAYAKRSARRRDRVYAYRLWTSRRASSAAAKAPRCGARQRPLDRVTHGLDGLGRDRHGILHALLATRRARRGEPGRARHLRRPCSVEHRM